MELDYNKQKGFGLIIIILAILIIAVIAFGVINRRGMVEENKEIKNKAVEDIKNINNNLEKNNLEIQNNLK